MREARQTKGRNEEMWHLHAHAAMALRATLHKGVKDWSTFLRLATCVLIETDGEREVCLHPRRKRQGDCDHLTEHVLRLPAGSEDEELGRAMLEAFERCR